MKAEELMTRVRDLRNLLDEAAGILQDANFWDPESDEKDREIDDTLREVEANFGKGPVYVVLKETPDEGFCPIYATRSLANAEQRMRDEFVASSTDVKTGKQDAYFLEHTDWVAGTTRADATNEVDGSPCRSQFIRGWRYDDEPYAVEIHRFDCPCFAGAVYPVLDGDTVKDYVDSFLTEADAKAYVFDGLRKACLPYDSVPDETYVEADGWYSHDIGLHYYSVKVED